MTSAPATAEGQAGDEPSGAAERLRPLPAGFRLGAATASYQIEGAVSEGGRLPSIWDTFVRQPGAVVGGDTGDVAVDHYHRYREDVGLMRELGLTTYRFSLAWPRLQPEGRGRLNPAGVDFYARLLDELGSAGVEPWVTLYHWDLPQALEDAGGWPERDTAERFADYAAKVQEAFGDRLRTWTTLNEPWCSSLLGYAAGVHAPGRREPAAAARAVHHLLLGHGLAARALRDGDPGVQVGLTVNLYAVSAATRSPEDLDAARRIDGVQNRLFLDPVLLGRYPADVSVDLESIGAPLPVRAGDLEVIGAPLDFLGVNYYSRHTVAAGHRADAERLRGTSPHLGAEDVRIVETGRPRTATGWEVDSGGLVEVLTRVHRDYPPLPLLVTENGAAYDDVLTPEGQVHDSARVTYLRDHLHACLDAVDQGVPLRGYLVWTLLDNFEWAEGYGKRFGLYYVDYPTQRRFAKDSARFYAEVSRRRGVPLPDQEV